MQYKTLEVHTIVFEDFKFMHIVSFYRLKCIKEIYYNFDFM